MRLFCSTALALTLVAAPVSAAERSPAPPTAETRPALGDPSMARVNAALVSWLGGMAVPAGTGLGHWMAGEPARAGWVSLGTLGLETGGVLAGYQLGYASALGQPAGLGGADSLQQVRSVMAGALGAALGYALTATAASVWAAWDVYHLPSWRPSGEAAPETISARP